MWSLKIAYDNSLIIGCCQAYSHFEADCPKVQYDVSQGLVRSDEAWMHFYNKRILEIGRLEA